MAVRDAKACPLEYTRSARRAPTAQVGQHIGEQVRTRRRKQALVAYDLVAAQADMVSCMCVVEPIALKTVGLAQVLPALLVDEHGVAEAEGPIHQRGMAADVRAGNDHEHGRLLGLLNEPSWPRYGGAPVWSEKTIAAGSCDVSCCCALLVSAQKTRSASL